MCSFRACIKIPASRNKITWKLVQIWELYSCWNALNNFAAFVKYICIAFSSYRTNLYGVVMLQHKERPINYWQEYMVLLGAHFSSNNSNYFAASVEYECSVFASHRNNLHGTVMLLHKESGSSCWHSHGKTLGHVEGSAWEIAYSASLHIPL